jgi:hypothetical protein
MTILNILALAYATLVWPFMLVVLFNSKGVTRRIIIGWLLFIVPIATLYALSEPLAYALMSLWYVIPFGMLLSLLNDKYGSTTPSPHKITITVSDIKVVNKVSTQTGTGPFDWFFDLSEGTQGALIAITALLTLVITLFLYSYNPHLALAALVAILLFFFSMALSANREDLRPARPLTSDESRPDTPQHLTDKDIKETATAGWRQVDRATELYHERVEELFTDEESRET